MHDRFIELFQPSTIVPIQMWYIFCFKDISAWHPIIRYPQPLVTAWHGLRPVAWKGRAGGRLLLGVHLLDHRGAAATEQQWQGAWGAGACGRSQIFGSHKNI